MAGLYCYRVSPGCAGIPGNKALDKPTKEAMFDGEVLIPDTPNEINQIVNIIRSTTRNDQLLLFNATARRLSNPSFTQPNLGIYHHLNQQSERANFCIRSGHWAQEVTWGFL